MGEADREGEAPADKPSAKEPPASDAPADKPAPSASKPSARDAPPKKPGPVRRFFRGLGIVLLVLLVVMVIKALATTSKQVTVPPAEPLAVDEAKAAEHLARAVTFQTISHQDAAQDDPAAFTGLHAALREMFPKAHDKLAPEVVGGGSLLFTWKGKDTSKPGVLLMAHMDVVPVEPGTEGDWQKPPFSGAIADGFVWGRGTMDFKMGVVGILEAAEALLSQGHEPARTIYLAFGHDEEVGGAKGAHAIVDLLASRKVHLAYVVDEGMVITQGILKGIDRPVALIGLAEKGYVSVELVIEGQGGHSSMPPRPTPIGILASGIARLEANQLPARLDGPARLLFDTLAPEMPFGQKLLLSNLWLLSPIAKSVLTGAPATNALLRTTTAPTMLEGGIKDNVLPKRARGVVNYRILPGETMESVVAHVRRTLADDRIQVNVLPGLGQDPSPVSDVAGAGYKTVEKSIRQVFPEAIVAPSLVLGGTDSRHYQPLADGVYRFSPQRLRDEDRARYHGTNERLAISNFAECVRFYAQLIKNAD